MGSIVEEPTYNTIYLLLSNIQKKQEDEIVVVPVMCLLCSAG